VESFVPSWGCYKEKGTYPTALKRQLLSEGMTLLTTTPSMI